MNEIRNQKKQFLLFKENTKRLFNFYQLILIVFTAYVVTAIISSIKLENQYEFYSEIQLSILILVSISVLVKFVSFYILKTKPLTNGMFFLVLFIQITTYIPPLLQLVSFLEGVDENYCGYQQINKFLIKQNIYQIGYIIRHEGRVTPYKIILDLKINFPNCTEMESDGDVPYYIKYYSTKIIVKQCRTSNDTKDSCYKLDTLYVDSWNEMFTVQIISLSLAVLFIVSSLVLSFLLKSKHSQANQKVSEEIRHNLLNQPTYNQIVQFYPCNQQIPSENPQIYSQLPYYQNNQTQAYDHRQIYYHQINPQNNKSINQSQNVFLGQPINI